MTDMARIFFFLVHKMSHQTKAELSEDTTKLGIDMAQSKWYQGPHLPVF